MGRMGQPRGPWLAVALGISIGLGAGCMLELEHRLSCGDGVVDVLAGEQCDPMASDSPHVTYCIDKGLGSGEATCNDVCQIEANADICAVCGDGKAAGDEDCDGNDLRGAVCPSGRGQLGCKSADQPEGIRCTYDVTGCDACGDGAFSNEVEECDFSTQCDEDEDCAKGEVCDVESQFCISPGDLASPVECTGLDGPKGPYTYGAVTNADCTEECAYGRQRCNYCDNGELDGEYMDYAHPLPFMQKAEVCDGGVADRDALVSYCQELCTGGPNMTTLQLRCEFMCNETCDGFVPDQAWEDPIKESARCCVLGGEPCDGPGGFPCCYALDHPEDAEKACLDNTLPKPLCRSG